MYYKEKKLLLKFIQIKLLFVVFLILSSLNISTFAVNNYTAFDSDKYNLLTGSYLLSNGFTQQDYLENYIFGQHEGIGQLNLGGEEWAFYTGTGLDLNQLQGDKNLFTNYLIQIRQGFLNLNQMDSLMNSYDKNGIGYIEYCSKNPGVKFDENGVYCNFTDFRNNLLKVKTELSIVQGGINDGLLEILKELNESKTALVCPPGKGWDGVVCSRCNCGEWNNGTFLKCQNTAPGKYTINDNNGYKIGQDTCLIGTFSNGMCQGDNGNNSCEIIPVGSEIEFDISSFRINSRLCQAGEYQDVSGEDSCKSPILAGYYSSIVLNGGFTALGSIYSSKCNVDYYCPGGINPPIACDINRSTNNIKGKKLNTQCKANAGYYGTSNNTSPDLSLPGKYSINYNNTQSNCFAPINGTVGSNFDWAIQFGAVNLLDINGGCLAIAKAGFHINNQSGINRGKLLVD